MSDETLKKKKIFLLRKLLERMTLNDDTNLSVKNLVHGTNQHPYVSVGLLLETEITSKKKFLFSRQEQTFDCVSLLSPLFRSIHPSSRLCRTFVKLKG